MKILPVIMAGGSGTRLWPLSRENYPKQFIKIFDGKSLLQHTLLRNKEFGRPVLIVGTEHRFIALEQLQELGLEADIILEPEGKNTAPCAIIAALFAKDRKVDTVLLLPADHYIENSDEYNKSIRESLIAANIASITTIGIRPNKAHIGYGYIELDSLIRENIYKVKKFVEKPNIERATKYLESGNYCWNAGMFTYLPEQMIDLSKKLIPDMFKNVEMSYRNSINDLGFIRLEPSNWHAISADSIDYAIMEHMTDIAVVKANFKWNDLGSFSSIWEISPKDEKHNVISGDVITQNVENNYIYSNTKMLTALGVKDLIIINTEDAILVAHKDSAENVKKLVNELKESNRQEVKNSATCYRPWGSYQTIDEGELHKVKRIIVKPGQKLSLQYHHHRAEHWVVVRGTAEVEIEEKISILQENDSIYIPKMARHRLTNCGSKDLYLIEVQTGSYLGEDDIVRLTDVYGRK